MLLGLEALARPHADYGFEGPAEAFDLAEQVGHVRELDKLCVHPGRGGRAAAARRRAAVRQPLAADARRGDVDEDWLLRAVEAVGLDPARVVLEVTERFGGRTAARGQEPAPPALPGLQARARRRRHRNSGLELLRHVGPEFVKLDRGLVSAAPDDVNARAVLMAMATFASHTGAFVIAEGIEDDDMLRFIREIDDGVYSRKMIIEGGQGYGLGRPSADLNPPVALAAH